MKEFEDRWERALNDSDKQRKNLVEAMVVVVQVKKFGLQHSVTVGVWDDSERSTLSRSISSKFILLSKLVILI